MKESDIQRQILDYLKSMNIWAWRSYSGPTIQGSGFKTKSQSPGRPDIEGVLEGGIYLGIEVKLPKGKRRPEQIEWINRARSLGAVALFAESIEDVALELNKLKNPA